MCAVTKLIYLFTKRSIRVASDSKNAPVYVLGTRISFPLPKHLCQCTTPDWYRPHTSLATASQKVNAMTLYAHLNRYN